ncbi:MAG TPA: hydrogenase maturation nickel metallochaperone HypA [Clostridia bacterium]|nr:hydrogenase maturation nickel metallochaperone HypA [Clostridia bacterium]
MHELGVMIEVVKSVEKIYTEQGLTKIDALVLQIGELSPVIPKYIEACYPAAADGTVLENARLVIETLPGNGRCKHCRKIFNVAENRNKCPHCGSPRFELLSGREFLIKEIVAC